MTEDFFFVAKVIWEHHSIQKFLHTKKNQFHLLLGQTRAEKKVAQNRILGTLYFSASHPNLFLTYFNTPIGLPVILSSESSIF